MRDALSESVNILRILLGVLLLLGRRLFWPAEGILCFLVGFDLVTYRLTDWPVWAPQEDRHVEEAVLARGDHRQAARSGCAAKPGHSRG